MDEIQQLRDSVKTGLELIKDSELEGEVFGLNLRSLSCSIKDDQVINSRQQTDLGLAFRVIKNNRIGFSFTVPGQESSGLKRSKELAKLSDKVSDEFEFSLPQPQPVNSVKNYDKDIEKALTSQKVPAIAKKMIEGVKSINKNIKASQGQIGISLSQRVLANSQGVFNSEEITGLGCSITASISNERNSITASASKSSRRLDLEPEKLGRKASKKANSLRNKSKGARGGQLPVVLSPEALAQLLSNIIVPSLYGENIRRGKSVYRGQKGKEIASSNLTMRDDPTADWGIGSSCFDDEGIVSNNVPLIEGGRLTNFLYDLKESVKSGEKKQSTGNGIRNGFKSPPQTSARNLILETGANRKEELLAEGKIYVDRLLGAHTADAVSGGFSVAINPGWRLRSGEKKGRLDGFMLSGNMPQLLKRIRLAKDTKYVNMGHSISLPTCLLPEVNVAGRQ